MTTTDSHSFNLFCAQELNDAQRSAVLHEQGPILVIAGAGSGKTRVITARITNLILHQQVPAHQIVALTFTNKAALEMKHRIQKFLPYQKELPFIGTFHSYCVRLLRSNAHRLQIPFMSILDDDDQQKMINGIIHKRGLQKQVTAKQASYYISHIKNTSTDAAHFQRNLMHHPLMHDLYKAYEHEKNLSKCYDFDDLLVQTLKLFSTDQAFKEQHQAHIRHLLVDEYQDTNIVQHNLLKQMALTGQTLAIDSICAVGDEDQSIYSWRGATVTNILNFKADFASTTLVKIEQNYRSVQPILDTANTLIEHNSNRNKKMLWSERIGSDRIRMLTCITEYQEAELVAQTLLIAKQQKKLAECAVLYRTHAQSRTIEEALIKHAIPYKIIGGIQFYERKEIKDIIAYLRLIINPFDRVSLLRVINTPTRGFGAKFEEQLMLVWQNQPFLSYKDMLSHMMQMEEIATSKQKTIAHFLAILQDLEPHSSISSVLSDIITRTAYISFLKESCDPQEAQSRIDNVQELIDAAQYAESQGTQTVTAFIEQITLMQEKNTKQTDADSVILMSLHAAKGLEFDTVIITGLEETILPSSRSLNDPDALEEERRLLYVGITRAKERLLLTQTKHRYTYGRMQDQRTSRFIPEIITTFSRTDECCSWKPYQMHDYLKPWMLGTAAPQPRIVSQTPHTRPQPVAFQTPSNTFKVHQPVAHAVYGTGIIEKIEPKSDNTHSITVRFKSGTKKIVSSFLKTI